MYGFRLEKCFKDLEFGGTNLHTWANEEPYLAGHVEASFP